MARQDKLKGLGAQLRQRRVDRGITQAQLGARTQLSRSLVIRVEQGDPTVAIGNVERLLLATGGSLAIKTIARPTLEEAAALFADE